MLKAYAAVGLCVIGIFEKFDQVFDYIPKVEKHYEQFGLLAEMDTFMVNEHPVFLQPFIVQENEREQGYGGIAFRD